MAKTISQLPDATVVNGSDELIIQQSGVTKRATRTELMSGSISSEKFVPTGTSATGNGMYLPATNAVAISTDGNERMRIDASGKLLIGTSSATFNGDVEVKKNGATNVDIYATTLTDTAKVRFYNNTANCAIGGLGGSLIFYAPSTTTEAMRVEFTGNVGIGTSAPSYKLHVNGSVAGVGAYNDVSDAREKQNISYDFQHGLQTVRELKPAHFDYLGDGPQNNLGFIAQDIQQVLPGMVTTFNKTVGEGDEATTEERLAIKEANLIAVLVKAVQELDAKVSALEAAQ